MAFQGLEDYESVISILAKGGQGRSVAGSFILLQGSPGFNDPSYFKNQEVAFISAYQQ